MSNNSPFDTSAYPLVAVAGGRNDEPSEKDFMLASIMDEVLSCHTDRQALEVAEWVSVLVEEAYINGSSAATERFLTYLRLSK